MYEERQLAARLHQLRCDERDQTNRFLKEKLRRQKGDLRSTATICNLAMRVSQVSMSPPQYKALKCQYIFTLMTKENLAFTVQ